MASLNLRVAPPRPFTQNETHDSLTQHRFLFNNFYRKDKDFKPILKTSFKWDPRSIHYGVSENECDELETLLGNICSLLPFPYLTSRIMKETKSWTDVWDIIFSHYQAKPSQDTNLDFISINLNKSEKESYLTFYERLCHHQRTHLAPVGAVGTGAALLVNDVLTLSHQNLITMIWMQKINPRLPGLVALEFASELQSGTQITALVHRIAKRADALFQIQEVPISHSTINSVEDETDGNENENTVVVDGINKVSFGRNSRPQLRPGATKLSNNNTKPSRLPDHSSGTNQGRGATRPFCPSCQYLGSQLKLQVKYDHYPSECPRKDGVVNTLDHN